VFKKVLITGAIALGLLCSPVMGSALAQTADANPINSGDTAWLLVSSAMVLLMTPGLAFFYGGLVRSRNVLNTMMMSLILMALVGVTWTLWGYSLAFAPNAVTPGTGGAAPTIDVNPLIAVAFVATTVAPAAGLTWVILEWVLRGKPTALGVATGFLAGLVGVTPAAGFVTPIGAILIGSITSVCCFFAVSLKAKLQFDDSLDTFPVHGVGGTVGAILTGIFATKAVNSAGDNGLLFGNPAQLWEQIVGVVVTYIFAGIGTFVILKLLRLCLPQWSVSCLSFSRRCFWTGVSLVRLA